MTTIEVKKTLPDRFLSDILITAFDGVYGWSWNWFEPVNTRDKFWLKTNGNQERPSTDDIWLSCHVRLRLPDNETGNAHFDSREGFVIGHEDVARAIACIINDEYFDIWRPANDREKRQIIEDCGQMPTGTLPYGGNRRFWFNAEEMHYEVETGETARAYREPLSAVLGDPDDVDIDAPFADAIIQVAAFGKVIFG